MRHNGEKLFPGTKVRRADALRLLSLPTHDDISSMSTEAWAKIEQLARNLALALIQRGVPQEACYLAPETESEADAWVRTFVYAPAGAFPSLPDDAQVRRSLLARFRYVTAHASGMQLIGKPIPPGSENALLEIYLVDLWHQQFRRKWQSGETGIAPLNN
jgi:hypothetical protein